MKNTRKPRRALSILLLALFVLSIFGPTMSLAAVNETCSLCQEGVAVQYCRGGEGWEYDRGTHSYSGGTCIKLEMHCYADLICSSCGRTSRTTEHVCYIKHLNCGAKDQSWCIFPDRP